MPKFPEITIKVHPGETPFKMMGKVRRTMRNSGVGEGMITSFQQEAFESKDLVSTIREWVNCDILP
jgi:hypothetical protein